MKTVKRRRVYIIGAGFSGRGIAQEMIASGAFGRVVAFLDDAPGLIGTEWEGIPILGPIDRIEGHLEQLPADEAIIAMPSVSREVLNRVYGILEGTNLTSIRILPQVSQIIEGPPHIIQTRDLNPQDLLGRNPVTISLRESIAYLRGRRVLITGAGGSIGGELSRQLLSGGAERLYLFDHEENSLYEIEKELRLLQDAGVGEAATVVPVVGELKDRDFMDFILRRLKADAIFHCAAYKHVPMLEANPVEAIKNNVFGTKYLVDAATKHEVSRFVLISTDKAVDPVCVYGASKMLAEEIVLHAPKGRSDFMVVRFGNVLDSRGSIVPLFKKQIESGGPVTVTDREATRFFMTIPEAASLVLKAGGVGTGGMLYTLDMGEPVNIGELAGQMIRFYGFEPNREISIEYTGLRAGEKLTERLFSVDERPVETPYPRINRLIRQPRWNGDLAILIDCLEPVCFYNEQEQSKFRNRHALRSCLVKYIPSIDLPENEPEF